MAPALLLTQLTAYDQFQLLELEKLLNVKEEDYIEMNTLAKFNTFLHCGRLQPGILGTMKRISFALTHDPEWIEKLKLVCEMTNNVQDLEISALDSNQLPAETLRGIHLSKLTALTALNVDHTVLREVLINHPNLNTIYIGESLCHGSSCPLRRIYFKHPIAIYGGSSCLVGLLTKNTIVGMGVAIHTERDYKCTPARIMKLLRVGSVGRTLNSLYIQFRHHDGNVLRTISHGCQNLILLRLENIGTLARSSPRKGWNNPGLWTRELARLQSLSDLTYETKNLDFIRELGDEEEEREIIEAWSGFNTKSHPALAVVTLRYRGLGWDGRLKDVEDCWAKIGLWERTSSYVEEVPDGSNEA